MQTDRELLQAHVNGVPSAFAELVRRHVDLVYSAALRQVCGDTHRAQDVTQLVFIDLARRAPELANHTALRGWLYTSTHHAAANVVRGENRRRAREQEALAMQISDSESAVRWERLRPVLDEAMHELPERDRHAVLMRWFDQKPTTEIGEALGLSESAARRVTDRALDSLREILARRGITSTAAALGAVLGAQTISAAPAEFTKALAVAGAARPRASLTLLEMCRGPLVVLGLSLLANVYLLTAGLPSPARLPPEPLVPPPSVTSAPAAVAAGAAVTDWNDPMAVAQRLHRDGYSDSVLHYVVLAAVRLKHDAARDALEVEYTLNQPRWKSSLTSSPPAVRALRQREYEEHAAILKSVLGREPVVSIK